MTNKPSSATASKRGYWLERLLFYELAAIFFFVPAGRFHIDLGFYSFTTGYDAYKLFPILFVTWLAWRIVKGKRDWPQSILLLPLAILFLISLTAALISPDSYEASTEALEILLYLFFIVVLLDIPWDRQSLKIVAAGFVFGNLYLGATALNQFFSRPENAIMRVNATYTHPNALGAYAVLGSALLVWLAYQSRGFVERVWIGCALASVLFAALTCQSRAAYLAFVIAFTVLIVRGTPWLRRLSIVALVCAVPLAIVMTPNFFSRLIDAFSSSGGLRFHIWPVYMDSELATLPFFGIGLGPALTTKLGGWLANNPIPNGLDQEWGTHNAYLGFLFSTGLAGLFTFLWMMKIFLRQVSTLDIATRATFSAGIIGFLILMFLEDPLLTGNIPIAFFTLFAISSASVSNERKIEEAES